jgi:uncharacterized protein YbcI
MRPQPLASDGRGDLLSAISDGLAGLVKEFYGQGPTHAESYYEDDLVVCVLRGDFVRVEQAFLDAGRRAAVIEQRVEFRELMLDRIIAVVENSTSQRVVGFMSGNQQSADMMCEVFILAPADVVGEEPSSCPPASFMEVPGRDGGGTTLYRGDHGAY